MPAKFVVKKGSTGKFRFNLLATNGKVIATSEAYESKRAALEGIDSVKQNAPDAEVDDQAGGKPIGDKTSTSKRDQPGSATSERRDDDETETRAESKQDDDQEWSTAEMEINLGPCHYGEGEAEEEATMTAVREDGTGWIAICDKHADKAREDGFEPDKSSGSG